MLARTSTIHHRESGVALETPLLIPSFSSRGFDVAKQGESEILQIISTTAEFITKTYLISAYDIHNRYIPIPDELPHKPELIYLDSGGYEVSDDHDLSAVMRQNVSAKEWSLELYKKVIDEWPEQIPVMIISYDHPLDHKPFEEQVRSARRLFKGRTNHLFTFLIKREEKGHKTMQKALETACTKIEELVSFDAIGLTEKELGTKMIDRMVHIAKLRRAMDESDIKIPIHIFGALDPISACLYFLAGAEIFDGLAWIRYAYDKSGKCVYPHNHAAIEYGIHASHNMSRSRMLSENIYYLQKLQQDMRNFESTGDFNKLPNSAFLEDSLVTLDQHLKRGQK